MSYALDTDMRDQLAQAQRELAEARELQAASADVLRVISSSPTDIQPVFDAIAERAVRLCHGQFSFVVRFDKEILRFGASHGLTPQGLEVFARGGWRSSRGVFQDRPTRRQLRDAQSCAAP